MSVQQWPDGPCPECGNEGNNRVHADDYDRQCPKCGTFFNVESGGKLRAKDTGNQQMGTQ